MLGRVCGSDGSHASNATLTARLKLRARFIHNVTSRPTHLHQTSSSLFVSFPSAPPLWSECCFFSSSLSPPLFVSLFLSLICFTIEFHISFRIYFPPIFLFTKFNFFFFFSYFLSFICTSFIVQSASSIYVHVYYTLLPMDCRIGFPPPHLQGRIFLLVAALKPGWSPNYFWLMGIGSFSHRNEVVRD